MISDDERREVAARLRVLACTPDEIGITEHSVIRDLGISSGIYDDCCMSEDVLSVADLIDPTCHLLPSSDGGYGCDRCYTWFPSMKEKQRFCPVCGARVVDDDD